MEDRYTLEYDKLNEAQRQAVDTIEGPVLVVAGPGSGKTQLLALRVANILRSTEVMPTQVLCLTFTEAARDNMRKRLARFIGKDAYHVPIHTFHSFGSEILHRYGEVTPEYLGRMPLDPIRMEEVLYDILESAAYDNPLRSKRNGQFIFLRDIKTALGDLKKAGLSPQDFLDILEANQQELDHLNPILARADQISLRSKQAWEQWQGIVEEIAQLEMSLPQRYFEPLQEIVVRGLTRAIADCQALGKSTPLSAWKQRYLEKSADGAKQLKDTSRIFRMKAVAWVYQEYRDYLVQEGYIDFSDMILDALTLIRSNSYVRENLADQYRYILVDEFQDTNDAQMQFLYQLVQGKNRPNILAVGDDDQGIYRFQGAEVSHMMSFAKNFADTKIITLIKNYRSRQEILDLARSVITQGESRLEDIIEEIEKTLESAGGIESGEFRYCEFPTEQAESAWVAEKIEALLETGHEPQEIAVIARKHSHLQALIPHLVSRDIPVSYERSQNILEQDHIEQLITMARFIGSLREGEQYALDELLPDILSYPFWGLDRIEIWKFFENHRSMRGIPWFTHMRQAYNLEIRAIAHMFLDFSLRARTESMESMMYALMGKTSQSQSPYWAYYFGRDRLQEDEEVYLERLADITTLIETIRSYESGRLMTLMQGLKVIDTYARQGGIESRRVFRTGKYTVTCLTAHGSKGLEFETVFVINAHEQGWQSSKRSTLVFPMNLSIGAAKDDQDDFLRLFFVALTRAKRNLYLTYSLHNLLGKSQKQLSYLGFMSPDTVEMSLIQSVLEPEHFESQSFTAGESRYLESVLESYCMSASHLNAFLDVTYKGPQYFLEHYLLRFPSPRSPEAAYGNGFHAVLEYISRETQSGNGIPEIDKLVNLFETCLSRERLYTLDYERQVSKFRSILPRYLEGTKTQWEIPHKAEFSFSKASVVSGIVPITGKIDRLEMEGDMITVIDFKTSKPISSWMDNKYHDKLESYRRQLAFYGILVRNSGLFPEYSQICGRIDFLEPNAQGEFIQLSLEITPEEMNSVAKLIEIVYHRIYTLDFPDVSSYRGNPRGNALFLEYLSNIDK